MSTPKYPVIPKSLYPGEDWALSEDTFKTWFDAINSYANRNNAIYVIPETIYYFITNETPTNRNYSFSPVVLSFQNDIGEIDSITVDFHSLCAGTMPTDYKVNGSSDIVFGSAFSSTLSTPTDVTIEVDGYLSAIGTAPIGIMLGYLVVDITMHNGDVIRRIIPIEKREDSETYFSGELVLLTEYPHAGGDAQVRSVVAWPSYIPESERNYLFRLDGVPDPGGVTTNPIYTATDLSAGTYTITCDIVDSAGDTYPSAISPLSLTITVTDMFIITSPITVNPDPLTLCGNIMEHDSDYYAIRIDMSAGWIASASIPPGLSIEMDLTNYDYQIGESGGSQLVDAIDSISVENGTITSAWDSSTGKITFTPNTTSPYPVIWIKLDTSKITDLRYGFTLSPDGGVIFDWLITLADVLSTYQIIPLTHTVTCYGSEGLGLYVDHTPATLMMAGEPINGFIEVDVDGITPYIVPGYASDFQLAITLNSGDPLDISEWISKPGDPDPTTTDHTISAGESYTLYNSASLSSYTFTASELLVGKGRIKFKANTSGTRNITITLQYDTGSGYAEYMHTEHSLVILDAYSDIPHPILDGDFLVDFRIEDIHIKQSSIHTDRTMSPELYTISPKARQVSFVITNGEICDDGCTGHDSGGVIPLPTENGDIKIKPLRIKLGSTTLCPQWNDDDSSNPSRVETSCGTPNVNVSGSPTGGYNLIKIRSNSDSSDFSPKDVFIYIDPTDSSKTIKISHLPPTSGLILAIIKYSSNTSDDSEDITNIEDYVDVNKFWNRPTEVILPYGGTTINGFETKNPLAAYNKILSPREIRTTTSKPTPFIISSDIPAFNSGSDAPTPAYFAVGLWAEETANKRRPPSEGIITSSGPISEAEGSRLHMITPYGSYLLHDKDDYKIHEIPDVMLTFFLDCNDTLYVNPDDVSDTILASSGSEAPATPPINLTSDSTVGSKIWNFVSKAAIIVTPIVLPLYSPPVGGSCLAITKGRYNHGEVKINHYVDLYDGSGHTYYKFPVRVFIIGSTAIGIDGDTESFTTVGSSGSTTIPLPPSS